MFDTLNMVCQIFEPRQISDDDGLNDTDSRRKDYSSRNVEVLAPNEMNSATKTNTSHIDWYNVIPSSLA